MDKDVERIIEEWFELHDDGEFAMQSPSSPVVLEETGGMAERIVYATKQVGVCSWQNLPPTVRATIGVLAPGYGLPHREMVAAIQEAVGNRLVQFLGDMDPADLLVFAWLRSALFPTRVKHFGISDEYLSKLGVDVPASFVMKCSPSECALRPLLDKTLPDYREIVGERCCELLVSGRKMEIEAVVSALGSPSQLLMPAGS